jgi:hypothetical protein
MKLKMYHNVMLYMFSSRIFLLTFKKNQKNFCFFAAADAYFKNDFFSSLPNMRIRPANKKYTRRVLEGNSIPAKYATYMENITQINHLYMTSLSACMRGSIFGTCPGWTFPIHVHRVDCSRGGKNTKINFKGVIIYF